MYFGEDADGMSIVSEDTGFGYMVALFTNTFSSGTFRTVPDQSEGLKFMVFRLYHITVINVDYRSRGDPFTQT